MAFMSDYVVMAVKTMRGGLVVNRLNVTYYISLCKNTITCSTSHQWTLKIGLGPGRPRTNHGKCDVVMQEFYR